MVIGERPAPRLRAHVKFEDLAPVRTVGEIEPGLERRLMGAGLRPRRSGLFPAATQGLEDTDLILHEGGVGIRDRALSIDECLLRRQEVEIADLAGRELVLREVEFLLRFRLRRRQFRMMVELGTIDRQGLLGFLERLQDDRIEG